MDFLAPYIGFASVSLLVALSPGPSWVYSISTTLGQGRKAGMIGNLGNSSGILCHALATAFGLAALLRTSTELFIALKLLGVFYLGYLALGAFTGRGHFHPLIGSKDRSRWQIYRNGAMVSLFNPKISLLMLALLPQFIDPLSIYPERQILAMGLLHALMAGLVHTHVVFFSALLARRFQGSGHGQRLLRWATGCCFLGFGLKLAFSRSS